MNRSTPGLPVNHKLPEFTQTYAHRVNDAIQPSQDPHIPLALLSCLVSSNISTETLKEVWEVKFCLYLRLHSDKSLEYDA